MMKIICNEKIVFMFMIGFNISAVYGQATVIKGNIKNTQGENMPQVLVVLKKTVDSTMLKFAYSMDNGDYELSYSGREPDLLLVVSGLGVTTQQKKIYNETQTVNFIVKEEVFQIKEVEIKATKIYFTKDTINYSVAAFRDEKDVVIGDVLKKLPGIDVAESGQISYQGRPINKFYIENMDMLNGRYGIATQNISAKDVSTVQVMENHQPIKAMDSLRISDQTAINIKLKQGAKGSLGVMAQLGIGASPLLWNNELTGMYFSGKIQNLTAYKTNNTGHDLTKELQSYTSDLNLSNEALTNIQTPSPPDISRSRYLFNTSHAATVNNLFNVGKDKELKFNLIYLNDREKRQSESVSSYYIFNDSILKIDEVIRTNVNINRIETEIGYKENTETRYLNNYLNIDGSWEDANGIIRNESQIDQKMHLPSFKAQNTFHLVQRKNDKGFEVYSQTGFQTTPHHLIISPGTYSDLFHPDGDYSRLRQDAHSQTFITKNNFRLLTPVLLKSVILRPFFGIDVEINNLTSELYPCSEQNEPIFTIPDSLKNNIQRNHYKAQAGVNIDYEIGKFLFNVSFPISFNQYDLDNRLLSENSEKKDRLYFEPSLDIHYILNRKITIGAKAYTYNDMNGIYEMYSGYLMQTYRIVNHYNNRLAGYSGNTFSLKMDYKDVIKAFFVGVNIAHYYMKTGTTYTQRFDDFLSMGSFIPQPNVSRSVLATGKINKGFDWMKMSSGLSIAYYTRSSQQFRQENLVNYRNNQYSVSCRLSALPVSFLIMYYAGTGQITTTATTSETIFATIRSFSHSLNLDGKIFKKLMIGTRVEQYINNTDPNHKSMYFADIRLSYTWKQIRFDLDWTNIFNTTNYKISYHDNLNVFASAYRIRPSEVVLKVKFKLK